MGLDANGDGWISFLLVRFEMFSNCSPKALWTILKITPQKLLDKNHRLLGSGDRTVTASMKRQRSPSPERQPKQWLEVVQGDGMALRDAPMSVRADREIVLAAVSQNGLSLRFASTHLKGDREIVRTAVTNNYLALSYSALYHDREIAEAAMAVSSRAFRFLPEIHHLVPV